MCCFVSFMRRLLGTPNEAMWPGVSKLMNWHEYPQWSPQSLSKAVPNLDKDGVDLLAVSCAIIFMWDRDFRWTCWVNDYWNFVYFCSKCCSMNPHNGFQRRKPWNTLTLMIWTRLVYDLLSHKSLIESTNMLITVGSFSSSVLLVCLCFVL